MKKKILKKVIVALCAAAMSVPAAASVGAINGEPDDANHQQQNQNQQHLNPNLNQFRVHQAQHNVANFLNEINEKTLNHQVPYDLDNEVIETSASLVRLQDALNNIGNVDLQAMGIGFEDAANYTLGEFNRYMTNRGNFGPLNTDKLENIKEKSDAILEIIVNDDDLGDI